jgi:hypothetical protein
MGAVIPVLAALLLSLFLAVAVGIAAAIPRVTNRENLLTPRGEERALEAATRTLEIAAALRARAAVQQDRLRVGMAASGVRVRARAAALPPVGRRRPVPAPLGTAEQRHPAARPEASARPEAPARPARPELGRSARHVAGPLRRSAAAARHRVAAAGRRRESTAAGPVAAPAQAPAAARPAVGGSGATLAVRRVRSASATLAGRHAHRGHRVSERELVSVGASSPVELPVEVDLRTAPAEPVRAGGPRRAAAPTTSRSPRPGPRHRG